MSDTPTQDNDDEADRLLLTQALGDERTHTPAADFPDGVRHRLAPLTEQGMLRLESDGYAVTYLGAFHLQALDSAARVWAEIIAATA